MAKTKGEKLYKVPSGLGGVFTVRILERDGSRCKVQPINPGWKTYIFWADESKLEADDARGTG